MNKILHYGIGLFCCLFTFQNLSAQSIGIGTDVPDAMFEVHGEAMISLGHYLILSQNDNARNWGIKSDGQHLSITEPEHSDKEYVRIEDDGSIFLKPNGITLATFNGVTNRVGIGTTAPAQKLEVDGVVRLESESHSGNALNRLATIDASGDINANYSASLAINDAVTYDISGRVVKPGSNSYFDLPGPLTGHTVSSEFHIQSTCNASATPIIVYFKRYGFDTQYAFAYKIGDAALVTSNASVVTFPMDYGCGVKNITISFNSTTNGLTYSITGTGTTGIYIQSARTTFFRWL